ncbi:MAG: SUF system Fe-S cluster assembly protein [Chthonomonadales bacterium]|nr:SUF system Fe-S cluster assembly protein [Chthonomonadales bacterium]
MSRTIIEGDVIEVLRGIYDPEIPVSIYDMGLVYGVHVADDGHVRVEMTLTAPGCPVAVSLPIEVEEKVAKVKGVTGASVEIVWDPPWTPERMSEEARLELGLF